MSIESSKPSRLAIISITLPILILLMWCIYLISFGIFTEGATNTADDELTGITMLLGGLGIGGLMTFLLSLIGTILSVMAIRKNDTRRGLAITGLVINLLILIPCVLVLALVLISGFTLSQPFS